MSGEDRFTPPSSWCPHPERWSARDIDATENEVLELVGALVRALQPDLCVETGTYLGDGTLAIAAALERNDRGVVHTFETHADKVESARVTVGDLAPRVVFHNSELPGWTPPGPVDFAFLDSSFGARKVEYLALLPFFSPQAVVVFHDTAPQHPLRRMLDELDLVLVDLPTPRGVSIGRPVTPLGVS